MAYAGQMPRVERMERAAVEAALARVTAVARIMDALFEIPGTRIKIGVDALIGVVPIVGDLISQAISTYIIWEARQLGVSKLTLWRMVANTLIDTAIGIVPVAGDAFDVMFRANIKNLRLLQRHLEKNGYQMPELSRGSARRDAGGGSGGRGPVIDGEWNRVG